MKVFTISCIFLYLVSCQHNRQLGPVVKSNNKKKIYKKKTLSPIDKYKSCLIENPKNIICNWEIGWIYYVNAQWTKVQHHWNIVRYISKNPAFQNNITDRLLITNDLVALQSLNGKYKRLNTRKVASKVFTEESFEINAVGDIMLGLESEKSKLPHLINDPFKNVRDILKPDKLNFSNLEGMFCDNPNLESKCKDDPKNCYSFRTPTKYLKSIVNTFNLASLANNHTLDYGVECLKETQNYLNNFGIPFSNGRNKFASFKHKKLSIAFLAFHTGDSFSYNVNKIEDSKSIIIKVSKDHDIVIVSFHGGSEGHKAPRVPFKKEEFHGSQRGDIVKFSRSVVDAGADIVLGHGPHIVRGMELYKNRLISYSLGNFSTFGEFNLNGLLKYGLVLNIKTDKRGKFIEGKITSTVQREKGIPFIDHEKNSLNYIRVLSKIDFPKSKLQFSKEGIISIENNHIKKLTLID